MPTSLLYHRPTISGELGELFPDWEMSAMEGWTDDGRMDERWMAVWWMINSRWINGLRTDGSMGAGGSTKVGGWNYVWINGRNGWKNGGWNKGRKAEHGSITGRWRVDNWRRNGCMKGRMADAWIADEQVYEFRMNKRMNGDWMDEHMAERATSNLFILIQRPCYVCTVS
jgi:hypothetical protein